MKFSNTIKTVLKIYQKYVKNSVWFGMGKVLRQLHGCLSSEKRKLIISILNFKKSSAEKVNEDALQLQ